MPLPPAGAAGKENCTPNPLQFGAWPQLLASFTLIAGVIINVLEDVALPQGEFPKAVSVSVTKPAALSAALGVYVAVVNEVGLVKVPVPLDDHSTPV